MNLEEINNFLERQYSLKTNLVNKFPEKVKQRIISYASNHSLNVNDNLHHIFYMMKNNIKSIPLCKNENCSREREFETLAKGYKPGCCEKHTREINSIIKYGVKSPNQSDIVKNKKIKSSIKKYGTKSPLEASEIRMKAKETMLKKYGVDNPMKSDFFKEQVRKTNNEKYGCDYGLQATAIKNKGKETLLKKYGVTHNQLFPKFKEKFTKTMLMQFGVENPSFSKQLLEKKEKNNFEKYGVKHTGLLNNSFKRKEYKWESGEISMVQGYEPIVLKELETTGYKFEEIFTSPKDMPEIFYSLDEKIHRYYPDIFIPKDNIIIEVKSEYTLNKEWDKNQAKFEATKSLGFDFRLEVR